MRTRDVLEKADLSVQDLINDGGYLNPMQANTFIRLMIDQPTILNQVRVVPMTAPTMEINKIGFTSRILKKAPASGTALAAADRSKPATEKVELSTKEVIAEVHLPYDVLEDNIERGQLEDTVMSLIAERASLDVEELIIDGNTGSGDDYLALADGILVQSTSHVVDYTAAPVAITKTVFKDAIKAMPSKYLRNRAMMRFWTSVDAEIEYTDHLADRETQLGDSRIARRTPEVAFGVPIDPVALMPDDKAIFTWPKNVILGVQRQIMIETDRDIRARVLIVVLTMRMDIKFEEEDSVVKILGLEPNPTTTTT